MQMLLTILRSLIVVLGVISVTACQTTKPAAENKPVESVISRQVDGFPVFSGQTAALKYPVHVMFRSHPKSDFQIQKKDLEEDYTSRLDGTMISQATGGGLEILAFVDKLDLDGDTEKPDLSYRLVFEENGLMVDREKNGTDFDRLRWELLGLHPDKVYLGEFVLPIPVEGFEQDRSYGIQVEDAVGAQEGVGAYRLLGMTLYKDRPSLVFDFDASEIKGFRIVDIDTGATVVSEVGYKTNFRHIIHKFHLDTDGWPTPRPINEVSA